MLLLSLVMGLANAESYFRADAGATTWIVNHPAPFTAPVSSNEFTFGRKMGGLGLELGYRTDVWNGAAYDQQSGNLAVNNYFQGDCRMNAITIGGRKGFQIGKKVEAGLRFNVGAAAIPVLMDEASFDTLVVAQSWGLTSSPNHRKMYTPVTVGGYADLYRFYESLAVGLNTDIVYVTGWDTGVRVAWSLNSRF